MLSQKDDYAIGGSAKEFGRLMNLKDKAKIIVILCLSFQLGPAEICRVKFLISANEVRQMILLRNLLFRIRFCFVAESIQVKIRPHELVIYP